MNKVEYEAKLKNAAVSEGCACPNHGLQIIELKREEFGYKCPKCDYSYPYNESVNTHYK